MTTELAHIVEEEGDRVALCGAAIIGSGTVTAWQLCQECLNLSLNLEDDE